MIEIIKDREGWNSFIKLFEHYDCYHTYHYHILSKKESETPILLIYQKAALTIAIPLLLRPIPESEYQDATSVYGYAGPLHTGPLGGSELSEFKMELQVFLKKNKIVSIFSRLHPYIEGQEKVLEGIGCVTCPGSVVNIDISKPLDIQRQKYNSRLKTYVNKARRVYSVIDGTKEKDIEEFIQLYYENMGRVHADKQYYFDRQYFYKLMLSSFFKAELLLCLLKDTKEIIGGALFIKTGNIVQYHLSGSKEAYLQLNPVKLLIDEMRIRATKENFKYFNLGGGKGIKEDSLFRFKSTFSHDFKDAKLWKYTINKEVYDVLTESRKKVLGESFNDDPNFFPAYRKNQKTH
ncbi:GNAT family N-acetyltransferase [Pareuzebyella sediminis]|uniref:GNAT family N-acetyltransferase n=1 Tax=Pareuzebyella sediminis TaxID=2607998 RepID=UPI0011EDFA09|nr:GNAT family N-acetyltransferase [Pareuzebyella sediminis]